MAFLLKNDCKSLINAEDLSIIIASNDDIFNQAVSASVSQAKSYLNSRYDVDLMFIDVLDYSFSYNYLPGNKVFLFAEEFVATKVYAAGQFATSSGIVYKCILTPTALQNTSNVTYWTAYGLNNTLYNCILAATGKQPNETTYFTATTNRDSLLIRLLVDLVVYELHSRINPRNIPEFRIVRYNNAVKYLKESVDPRKNVNPSFPLIVFADDTGVDISYGTTINNNTY